MTSPTATVEHLYDRFAAGDLAGALELLDPQVEWTTPTMLPWSRGSYRGHEEVMDYFKSFGAALSDAAVVPERILGCGEAVVSLGNESGKARETGRGFSVPFAHVFTVQEGRITSMRGHVDTAAIRAAFEAAEDAALPV